MQTDQAGLWEELDCHEVHGLGQVFRTPGQLKARGYAFAFRYGSESLKQAFAWLDFPQLREFRKVIETGPLDLRDALDAAFAALDDPAKTQTTGHVTTLKEHTGNWFGAASDIRRLLTALKGQS